MKPRLSVIVPSVNGVDDLERSLGALVLEMQDLALEILVVERRGEAHRRFLSERFPQVIVIPAEPRLEIPRMRALGFRVAKGEAVAVIEDHVIVPRGWALRMLAALADSDGVVGGSVANAATESRVDRAAFLCEYHHLLPPIPGGWVDSVCGNNVIYSREVIDRHREAWEAGRWEDHLHAAVRADGRRLKCHPEIVVGHAMHYDFGLYMGQRFLYSRSYAAFLTAGKGGLARLVRGVASLVLPPVLLFRIFRRVWPKAEYRRALLAATPLLVCFVCSWALGESWGALFGAGDAPGRVR